MELENFYKNVIPVSEYFDQSGLLSIVNGERNPAEVYKDFRSAVFEVLSSQDDHNAILNGVVGMGRGMNEIPGTIVSVETAPNNLTKVEVEAEADTSETIELGTKPPTPRIRTPQIEVTRILENPKSANNNVDFSNLPPIIWVIGGPGSNKSTLCLKAVALNPGWSHFRYELIEIFGEIIWSRFNLKFHIVALVESYVPSLNLIRKRIRKIIKLRMQ